VRGRSDHCPAMKGIEIGCARRAPLCGFRSDHCPAMKGIEICEITLRGGIRGLKRPLPRNEGD